MGTLMGLGRPTDNTWDPADRPFIVGGVVLIVAVLTGISLMLGLAALDVWSGLIVFLLLLAASVPMLRRVAKAEDDPWLFKVMYGGLVVKLLSSLIRYFVIFVVYGGNGDAGVYHEAGTEFARRFAAGDPIHPLPKIEAFPVETQRIGDIVGGVYTVTSPSAYAGFFIFSFLCFWGLVLMLRGFKAAVPEGDYRRYAVLVLYLPSLLFWPSSMGKEAVMLFCLGLVVYGGALLLAPKPRVVGVAYFLAGTVLLAYVRPHIALMSIAALVVAMAFGVLSGSRSAEPGVKSGSTRSRVIRTVGLVALLAVSTVVSSMFSQRFTDGEDGAGTRSTLEETTAATSLGGSEFQPITITTPAQVPLGVPSVLFRPFPWEAKSVNALIAAVEGLLLLGLFATSWRRLVGLPKLALRRPFLVFAMAYIGVFAMGFSFIANFGILARQRTQMLPMVLMLLALPATAAARRVRSARLGAPVLGENDPDLAEAENAKELYSMTGFKSSTVGERGGDS